MLNTPSPIPITSSLVSFHAIRESFYDLPPSPLPPRPHNSCIILMCISIFQCAFYNRLSTNNHQWSLIASGQNAFDMPIFVTVLWLTPWLRWEWPPINKCSRFSWFLFCRCQCVVLAYANILFWRTPNYVFGWSDDRWKVWKNSYSYWTANKWVFNLVIRLINIKHCRYLLYQI